MIDLHTHSSASDGLFSPEDSAKYAVEKGLGVWALTDHDTVSGLHDAARVCLHSETLFVPGVELNIRWSTGEFHLLGLGLQRYSEELKDVIADLTESRRVRTREIIEKMNAAGIPVTEAELKSEFPGSQIGRPHFAAYLMKQGKVRTRQEAFTRFLGKGKPFYVWHEGVDLDVAVDAVKSAGGVPVLAHPLSLYVSWGKMEETIEKIKRHGVEGIEAWHPGARESECLRLEQLARKLGLFVTGGSDYHGKGMRADRHLGRTSGDRRIDDRFWTEELAPHLRGYDVRDTDWVRMQE